MPGDYATIQEAMNAATAGDTVFVSPGTYTGVNEFEFLPGWTVQAVVIMKPGVTLYGRPDAAETVIIQAADSTQGIFCQDGDSTTAIVGLTVTGGRSGFMGRMSSPTISHCRFVGNQSPAPFNSGGGMYGDYFSPTITDCLFADNLATSGGGATFANESFPVLRRCTFQDNHAFNSSHNPGHGGALTVAQDSEVMLIDCSVTGNEADEHGGAVYLYSAVARFENVVMTGNSAGENGGAVFVHYRASLELAGVVLTGNTAMGQGGGIYVTGESSANAVDSTLRDNTAAEGPDGFLDSEFQHASVTLTCCDVDPAGWVGDDLVIDDSDCD